MRRIFGKIHGGVVSQDNNYSRPHPFWRRAEGRTPLTFGQVLGLTFFSAVRMWTEDTRHRSFLYHFFLAVLFGNLLLGIIYTAFLGYIGAKTGPPPTSCTLPFGVKGSWLPRCC